MVSQEYRMEEVENPVVKQPEQSSYSKKGIFKEPVNGFTHLFAAISAGFGLIVLLYLGKGELTRELSLLIYGISLIAMFSASAAYHLVKAGPRFSLWLRRLDHCAIFLLIAGTYTPICLHFFTGFWKWGLLSIVWSLAFAGILIKLFYVQAPRGLSAGMYLLLGWLAVAAIGQILDRLPAGALAWLASGGLLFTIGAVIYVAKRPNLIPGKFGFHEIWHIFVILGALSHYILIARYIAWLP
jgi:hemolysin III